jgi:hypothetical protein
VQQVREPVAVVRSPGAVPTVAPPPFPSPALQLKPSAEVDDFPMGWELSKESWHFHRRFYAVFRRPITAANTCTCSGRSGAARLSIWLMTAGEAERCRFGATGAALGEGDGPLAR